MARQAPAPLLASIAFGVAGLAAGLFWIVSCRGTPGREDMAFRGEVRKFLEHYTSEYAKLWTDAQEARWTLRTHIVAGDDASLKRARSAVEALAAFTGSVQNIELTRAYGRRRQELTPGLQKELEAIFFTAGGNPQTVPELVHQKIAAEMSEIAKLDAFERRVDGRVVSTNEIDDCLRSSTDLARRQAAWEASKSVGPTLRDGLVRLRGLRNDTVRALGFKDYLDYKASEYGWTGVQLARKLDEMVREMRPLYVELHTWARYELARHFSQPVPELIPAHWLPSRSGERWDALLEVEGFPLQAQLVQKTPQWILEEAERTWVGLGFDKLPSSFWERSVFHPQSSAGPKTSRRKSAWHIDLDRDVRLLDDVEPGVVAYEDMHAEMGRLFYALTAANPKVPLVLRAGANRAFPLAVGATVGFAARQPRFLESAGTWSGPAPDATQLLLAQALEYVPSLFWSAGTVFGFEEALYRRELPPEHWNEQFWKLAERFQGIAPPFPRDERWCDACAIEGVTDDPAGSFDEAIAVALLFQFHDHIARKVLDQEPHDANYFGRREVGVFFKSIMKTGATGDWRPLLLEKTGYDLSAHAMADYFKPLRKWLAEQNKGRKSTLRPL